LKAVILVAGKSTRTHPLTLSKPKPLLKIANTTLLEYNLNQLVGLVEEVILVVGYKKEMIKDMFGDSFKKVKITYVEQIEQNGTGGALLSVKNHLKGKFLVMNGDDLFSKKDIKRCLKHNFCILGKEVADLYRFGEVVANDDVVQKIIEKPNKDLGVANTGIYVFDERIFEHELKISVRGELEIIDYVNYLIENYKVNLETVEDYWLPITYLWNLLDANTFMLNKLKLNNEGIIEKGATLKGAISIGQGTLIKSGAYIEGPVLIGKNCIIGPNCYIRSGTTIGNNSKIGNAVEVKNCIIGDNTSIGHLSYAGDSVIGNNVNFGAGSIIANLRHDNTNVKSPVKDELIDSGRRKLGAIISDGVKLGIKTTIYPGRKIWPGITTLPSQIVEKDLK
jgi:UDP-N-acetylglucosamine diphosphorylase / glucose-1-phosphate thymidylyltransferase / UDP-N-acetylgalactosamine diphosphorylase / glucosamine-1-phosphate N-acetyltransferase / galactosamine-1-phosphate N-acetyltransferase